MLCVNSMTRYLFSFVAQTCKYCRFTWPNYLLIMKTACRPVGSVLSFFPLKIWIRICGGDNRQTSTVCGLFANIICICLRVRIQILYAALYNFLCGIVFSYSVLRSRQNLTALFCEVFSYPCFLKVELSVRVFFMDIIYFIILLF